ncbi:MAG: transposase, partial [Nitrosopumilaceae archaeon]|nr:transposase [Nitrosopumilaceae archaeon]
MGKPTFSFAYTPQYRSTEKGKLWYFDVSGGGDIAPSLLYGNRYTYLFTDSFSRIYFTYFTKEVNDRTTLLVLNIFAEQVLTMLPESDDMRFIQSDNGQIDSNNVKGWIRQKRLMNRFIHPYHPNMNGFAERAFRSIKDLARCMMHHAGLPEPYWEKATNHACLIRNIMPNQTQNGFVREAYYLWYGLVYDYSRLRTWGSRAYALNHVQGKNFLDRSVPGIFVGMKPQNPISYDYELYIPAKNVFITSGDVIFCEHVGRTEPERLLAPKVTLRESDQPCRPEDFSYLVDTIHMDNDEGVRYKVVRVYTHKGLVVVDRVLYDPEHRDVSESPIDTVHLKEVLNYPILEGAQNPNYQVPAPMSLEVPPPGTSSNDGVNTDSRTTGEGTMPVVQESARQKAKRLRDEAQQAAEIRRIEAGFRRSKRVSAKINLCASDWKLRYANTIYQWFIDQI